MVAKRVNGVAAAVHEIDHTFWQTSFFEQFKCAAHRQRHALGRLQNERISASDGVRQKPIRDHRRKIEWRDSRYDAERLANLHFVDARRDVFQVVALHHHGDAAGDFDIFDRPAHLRLGLGESFSVFGSDDARQFFQIFFEKISQLEEILNALAGRSAAPGGKRGGCRFDGGIHIGR